MLKYFYSNGLRRPWQTRDYISRVTPHNNIIPVQLLTIFKQQRKHSDGPTRLLVFPASHHTQFQYKIYDILKWSSRPIWKGVCVLGLTNIYLLNFTYDNNTVEMVSKTHLERRVFLIETSWMRKFVISDWVF